MSFTENFLYPLGLLIIGGGISAGLIPFFNHIHKEKLLEVEHQRELSQKRIDREREDYKFELEIKDRFFTKVSNVDSWSFSKLNEIVDCEDEEKKSEIVHEAYTELMPITNEIQDLITLYFGNDTNLVKLDEIYDQIIAFVLSLCLTPIGSEEREIKIKEFNKKFNIKKTEDEIKKAVNSDDFLYPLYEISRKRGELVSLMLKAKINLPHRN